MGVSYFLGFFYMFLVNFSVISAISVSFLAPKCRVIVKMVIKWHFEAFPGKIPYEMYKTILIEEPIQCICKQCKVSVLSKI